VFAPARDIVLANQYVHRPLSTGDAFYVLTAPMVTSMNQVDLTVVTQNSLPGCEEIGTEMDRHTCPQDGRGNLWPRSTIAEQHPDKMTDSDWEAMLATLSKNGEWRNSGDWRKSRRLIWSMRFLLRLQRVKWTQRKQPSAQRFSHWFAC